MTTSLTKDLLSAIDDIRGDVPRSIFVRRAVEQKVSELYEYRNKKKNGLMVNFSRAIPSDTATRTPTGDHVSALRSRDTSESDR